MLTHKHNTINEDRVNDYKIIISEYSQHPSKLKGTQDTKKMIK